MRSNLDNIVTGKLTLSVIDLVGMYLPYLGLPAAKIDVLAFSLATIPALAMLIAVSYTHLTLPTN